MLAGLTASPICHALKDTGGGYALPLPTGPRPSPASGVLNVAFLEDRAAGDRSAGGGAGRHAPA
ncbi:hypothetical protein B8W90_14400, partial [Staphylococcus hominis]